VVEWDGRYTDPEQRAPLDFQTVEVYASPLPIESPHPALLVGTFPDPVGGLATIARSGGLWHVRLVTKSEPGRRSPMSEEVTATVVDPLDEEALEELNGSIDALERSIGEIEVGGDTLMERLAQLRTDLGEAESALEEARQGLATAFPGGPFSVPERLANTLKDTTVEYAVGPSETEPPTSGWSASTPTRTPGTYIWFRTVLTYGDDSTSMTSPALLTGNDGAKGDKGDPGDDGLPGAPGVGLVDTVISYARSTSGDTAPTSGWQSTVPAVIKGQYLWTRTVWTYSDGSTETGYSSAYWATDGAPGDDGIAGKDGVGITGTTITYAQSTSGTTPPTSGWQATPPSPIAGRYIWTRTVWTYSDSTTETGYSVGKIGDTGAKGDKGDTGADGLPGADAVGLTGTAISYARSTSGDTPPPTAR